MKELKRNKDGTLEGIITMGDLIGPEMDADIEETGSPPPNVPQGVNKLILQDKEVLGNVTFMCSRGSAGNG